MSFETDSKAEVMDEWLRQRSIQPTPDQVISDLRSQLAAAEQKVGKQCEAALIEASIVSRLTDERDKAIRARKHTQEWYAQHYGKLQDWARKRLPMEWRREFFNCVANGTWGHEDLGTPYVCKAGFEIVPSNYFRVDTAEGQLILDQAQRAEDAELRITALESQLSDRDRTIAAVRGMAEGGSHDPFCVYFQDRYRRECNCFRCRLWLC